MERKKEGKEENKGKNRKNKLKLVKKNQLRNFACGTLIFCYGEENSAKKIRGGGKKSNLSKNILPCIYFIKFLICFMCKKNICTSFKSIISEFSFVIHLLNRFFLDLQIWLRVESKLIYLDHRFCYINRSIIKIESCKILASYDRPRTGC